MHLPAILRVLDGTCDVEKRVGDILMYVKHIECMWSWICKLRLIIIVTGEHSKALYENLWIQTDHMTLDVLRSTYFSYIHSIISYGISIHSINTRQNSNLHQPQANLTLY